MGKDEIIQEMSESVKCFQFATPTTDIIWGPDPSNKIIFEKIHPKGKAPEKAHIEDAGYDLFSCENRAILPGEVETIRTGIKVKFPPGKEMEIRSKSGLASKSRIQIFNSPATIDNPFRGEILVIMYNAHKWKTFEIVEGQKIGQALIVDSKPHYVFVEGKVDEDTSRGTGGLGSSGL